VGTEGKTTIVPPKKEKEERDVGTKRGTVKNLLEAPRGVRKPSTRPVPKFPKLRRGTFKNRRKKFSEKSQDKM